MSPSARSEKFTGNARCPLARLALAAMVLAAMVLAAMVLAVRASVSQAQTPAPQPRGSGAQPPLGEGSEQTPGAEP
ncbi:hypothetical protein, partial [Polaromonas sp.]|uniref:hypothetical protein n=1 Tax=Polaromonas sp. TaxID=1869339 RepID=UPI00286A3782